MGNRGGASPWPNWTLRVMDLAIRLMQFILSVLRNTDRPIPVYVWHAWLIDFIPGILIAAIVVASLFGTCLSAETHPLLPSLMTPTLFWEMVVKAPWTETLVMWPILFVLSTGFHKYADVCRADLITDDPTACRQGLPCPKRAQQAAPLRLVPSLDGASTCLGTSP